MTIKSQMPFGFWVLGNKKTRHSISKRNALVSNAFRLLGSGEQFLQNNCLQVICVSNAFRLLGSGEPSLTNSPSGKWRGLKCLSAFGFWGTCRCWNQTQHNKQRVSNAFRLLGSGEHGSGQIVEAQRLVGLKCLSAFGFWGTSVYV